MLRGRIFYRGEFVEAGIEVEDGRIKRIGKLVKGKAVKGIILPAGIDVHVHLRDFEEKYKETIESGTEAALHGGICLVVDQPNTKPVVDSEDVYFKRIEIAKRKSFVDYSLNLALTNSNFHRIGDLVKKIRQKVFLPAIGEVFLQHSNKDLQIDYETLKRVKADLITVHAEDPEFVKPGFPNFRFRERKAEIVAVEKAMKISDFHFCHISTRDAAEKIMKSNSTFEVTPHHLLLSTEDFERLKNAVNVNPPLRDRKDAEWLLKNFDKVDILASDHAPHTIDDKKEGAAGFPGVETMYPIFVHLAKKGVVSFKDLVEKIAVNPARIFGFRGYGEIKIGNFANFAVFDLKNEMEIKAEILHSKCGWTPYEGFKAIFPEKVFLRGVDALETPKKLGFVVNSFN